ncbi:zinc-binding alcohol dehydrogenase family protein [Vibrio sp.]|nr:zinc-binding alcohol dehydrogenase family protein [Vibrio sp.]
MKALVATAFGVTPEMVIEERPSQEVKPGFTKVRMHAATVNPLSQQIRTNNVPAAKAPLVLSNDGSGVVLESEVFAIGSKVAIYGGGSLGITEDGLQQQEVVVENKWIVELPNNISLDEAAAIPINYVSAFQAIHRVGQFKKEQTALISGASGSLGNALIQLVKAAGGKAIAVVSTSDKVANAKQSGADDVIDLSSQDLVEATKSLTNGEGADIAFDPVAGPVLGQLLRALKTRGAVVSIGFAGGQTAEIDVVDVVVYEKKLLGFDAHLETDEDVKFVFEQLKELIKHGKVKPRIDSVYTLNQYQEAYDHLISRKAQGTILLRLQDAKE